MDKKIMTGWILLFVLMFLMMANGFSSVKKITYTETQNINVRQLTDWKKTEKVKKKKNGTDIYSVTYTMEVPVIHNGAETLMFYSYHSDVSVYIDNKKIYSVTTLTDKSDFQPVLSNKWNKMAITKEYEKRTLRITFDTPYLSAKEYNPQFELGNELDIVMKQLRKDMLSLVLACAVLACGIYMTMRALFAKRNQNTYNIIYLGIFALLIGVWFLINISVTGFLITDYSTMEYLSYMLMGTLPLPFAFFEKQIVTKKYRKYLDFLVICNVLSQVVCVGLQMTGRLDMKESQPIRHIFIVLFVVCFFIIALLNIKNPQAKMAGRLNKVNIVYGMALVLAIAVDLVSYYVFDKGQNQYMFTKIVILMYVVTLAYCTLKETEELLEKGRKAEEFEMLAHTDELTGVYNRTAYKEDTQALNLEKEKYLVFMFDLNNLKQCNDVQGHSYGDYYIKSSAKIISEAFERIGKCYRIGGDEFCVVGKIIGEKTLQKAYDVLNEGVWQFNQNNLEIKMGIAFGYAIFDATLDETIEDTRMRADKEMYQHKKSMKGSVR